MKRSIGPQTFEKCPKSSKKSSFRQCFDLLSQNHQLRTITNLGHLTLEERKFQDFQESDSCPTCCLCYCVAHCSRWEKVDLASVGDSRAPNFEQKPLKMAILDIELVSLILCNWKDRNEKICLKMPIYQKL